VLNTRLLIGLIGDEVVRAWLLCLAQLARIGRRLAAWQMAHGHLPPAVSGMTGMIEAPDAAKVWTA
jgi:hypothetical protein